MEASDLAVVVSSKLVRTGMEQNFAALAPDLDKLQPDEVFDALEAAAVKVFQARPAELTQEHNADSRWLRQQQEEKSLADLKSAGLKHPLEAWNREDERRAREAAEYRAREDHANNEFLGVDPETEPQPEGSFLGTAGDF